MRHGDGKEAKAWLHPMGDAFCTTVHLSDNTWEEWKYTDQKTLVAFTDKLYGPFDWNTP